MTKPIVVIGSINLDLVAAAGRIPVSGETISGHSFNTFPGGKGANQAVAVARLGHPVTMVGNVGDDVFGPQLKRALHDVGVNTRHVTAVPGSSGVALIITGPGGENCIVVVPGANGQLTPEQLEANTSTLREAELLLAQLEIPLETVEFLAHFSGKNAIPLMLDPAPAHPLSAALLKKLSWLTPNETETQSLLGISQSDLQEDGARRAAESLLALGVKNVVLKLGSRGCLVATGDGHREFLPAFKVNAVDTTAAGDAFNGAFAIGLAKRYSLHRCAVYASAAAAISVTRAGAQPSMPSERETQSFLEAHEEPQDP